MTPEPELPPTAELSPRPLALGYRTAPPPQRGLRPTFLGVLKLLAGGFLCVVAIAIMIAGSAGILGLGCAGIFGLIIVALGGLLLNLGVNLMQSAIDGMREPEDKALPSPAEKPTPPA